MHVNYLITDKIRIKDIVYCINHQKILYYVAFQNPRNLHKSMNKMKQQLRKLYSYDEIPTHMNRVQIIDMYNKCGSQSKRKVDYLPMHGYINDYMTMVKEMF